MNIVIRKNILSDNSETFDLIISDGNGGRVELAVLQDSEADASNAVNEIHMSLERACQCHIPWDVTFTHCF